MVEIAQAAPTVTRVEIINAIGSVFAGSGATKQDILAAAARGDCRAELIEVLHRIPERTFGHVRDLWDHLPDVPLER